jgi:hypothetical protein
MSEPIIADSARKHGVRDQDILHAFRNPLRTEDRGDGFTMLTGGSRTGELLEVGVADSEDGPVIIHAMPARKQYLPAGGQR